MKQYYYNYDLIKYLRLDTNKLYHSEELIKKLVELKLVKINSRRKSLIPSRKMTLNNDLVIYLNKLSKNINPNLKLLYSNKLKMKTFINYLWRFIDTGKICFPNKLEESDFRFIDSIEL